MAQSKWVQDTPTEPGFYFLKMGHIADVFQVKVSGKIGTKLWADGEHCRRHAAGMPRHTLWCGPFRYPPLTGGQIDPYREIFTHFDNGEWIIDVENGRSYMVDHGERTPFVGLGKTDPKEFRQATEVEILIAERNVELNRIENDEYHRSRSMMASLLSGDK